MPRSPRIEYENATYHVMARGNRRNDIVCDEGDRKIFFETLHEACSQSGWEVFAWVLLSNHYHLVLRTPEPNLVSGMTWFQNTFTRRINAKNKLWGRLFGDRYKAVLVESEAVDPQSKSRPAEYLPTLINYVHLNPARAGIVDVGKNPDASLLDFEWSSLGTAYAVSPSKRSGWMEVADGLGRMNFRDTAAGRRKYVEYLDERMRQEKAEKLGLAEIDGQTLHSTLRPGLVLGQPGVSGENSGSVWGGDWRKDEDESHAPVECRSEGSLDSQGGGDSGGGKGVFRAGR